MADFEQDPLADAFASFRTEVAPYVRSTGVAAAEETVRRRKRNHTIAAGALTALALAVPTIAYAAAGPHPNGAPQIADSGQPSPLTSSRPASPAPDGRISKKVLDNATLDLPAWSADASIKDCPSGPTTFHNGSKRVDKMIVPGRDLNIREIAYADVDRDGAQETIARISCGHLNTTDQVVAFDRDTDGTIHTLGQVAVQAGAIKVICGFRVGDKATVDVQVGDQPNSPRCPDNPLRPYSDPTVNLTLQWRTYAWNGSGFTQIGGPTTFPSAKPSVS